MDLDETLKALLEDWVVDESTILKQVRQFSFEDFTGNEQRLDSLVRLSLKLGNNNDGKIQQTSTLSEVLVQVTTILLCSGCHEHFPSIFDSFVRLLWKLVSGENANVFKTRQLRTICCECLREIELCVPGALEALVRPRNGQHDERSLLETLVAEERSTSFQSYLNLLMTVLSSPPSIANGGDCGVPSSSAMHTVALALDSCGVMSMYARADLILMICSYAKHHENETVCGVVGERCVEVLGNQSNCVSMETLLKSLVALRGNNSSSSSASAVFGKTIHGVDQVFHSLVHDQGAFISLRYLALSMVDFVKDGSLNNSNDDNNNNNVGGWPSPFDSLDLATTICISSLRKMKQSNLSTVSNELLSSMMWFVEDYWRENPPGKLTEAAFRIYDVFVELFPQHANQVADSIIHGALLRGGSRFFVPIHRIIDLGGRNDNRKSTKALTLCDLSKNDDDDDANYASARRIILERIADAVLDVSIENELGGYLEVLLFALVQAHHTVSKRILKTLERFVDNFEFDNLVACSGNKKNGFSTVMAFMDCIRVSLWLSAKCDLKAFRFCIQLLDDFEGKCENDFVILDEIRVIRNSATRFRNGVHEAESILLSLDNTQALDFARLSNATMTTKSFSTNVQIKNQMLGPLKRRTIPMDRMITLRRTPCKEKRSIENGVVIEEEEEAEVEKTTFVVQDGEYLLVPLNVEWKGGEQQRQEGEDSMLFAIAIHLLSNPNLALVGSHPSPILIPHLSSIRPSYSVVLKMQPSFPMPMRLCFRALATTSNGWMVEGALQDIHLDFKDFFCSIPSSVHDPSIQTVIVRSRLSLEQFDSFKHRVFGSYLENNGGDCKEWKARVNLLTSYSLQVYSRYLEQTQQAVFECSVNHWVLLSYLDELFKL